MLARGAESIPPGPKRSSVWIAQTKSPAGEDGAVGVDKVPRGTAKAITDGGFA
jgi:hypothetical protein